MWIKIKWSKEYFNGVAVGGGLFYIDFSEFQISMQ